MNIFVFGSSILSSYWNGAATYYRGIYKYLHQLGHSITFAEPDAYGRQQHLDEGDFSYVTSNVYRPALDLAGMVAMASRADVIIKHSGIGIDDDLLDQLILKCASPAIRIFWDVDAPATLGRIEGDPKDPFLASIPKYDAVFTYGGGPKARECYKSYGARYYTSIYNGLDPETHYPVARASEFVCDLAFLGNRMPDREARVDELLIEAARRAPMFRFILGGEGWADKTLPDNVKWIGHVPTSEHNRINSSARMVMNINRASMASFGYSPPTRVFEVAGVGACLLCDDWPGIDDCFETGKELLVVKNAGDVVTLLHSLDEAQCQRIGTALLSRALAEHTYRHRAKQAEQAIYACMTKRGFRIDEWLLEGRPA